MEKLGPGDPQRIGAFRVLARLGAGSLGQVFLARSDGGRAAAVELVRRELAEQEGFRATLAQDVRAARRVDGRWTAPVLDADTEAEVPWVATAHVPGPTLRDVVDRDHGALPERSVHILAAGLAHALQDVHAAGLVHRALSPSNVLVTVDGPRVGGVGLARALEAAGSALAGTTLAGGPDGPPAFHAPEQVRGDLVTPACDVFSLGSVLAYAATGRRPFGVPANGVHALMFRVAQEEPDLTGLPESLSDLVSDCLRKDPATRPGAAEILARTGGRALRAAGRSPDPWLPASLVAHIAGTRWTAPEEPVSTDPRDRGDQQGAAERSAGSGRGHAPGAGAGGRAAAPTGPLPTVISKGTSGERSSPFVTPSPTGPFAPSGPKASPGRATPPGPPAAPGRAVPAGPQRPADPGRPAPATGSGAPNGTSAWPPVSHGSAAPRPAGTPGGPANGTPSRGISPNGTPAGGIPANGTPANGYPRPRPRTADGHRHPAQGPTPGRTPGAPDAPGTRGAPNAPDAPGAPGTPGTPDAPGTQDAPAPPGAPGAFGSPAPAPGAPGSGTRAPGVVSAPMPALAPASAPPAPGAFGPPAPAPTPGAPAPEYGTPLPAQPAAQSPPPNSRRGTVALIVAALVVAAGAGASVYALMRGDDGGVRTAPTARPSHPAAQDPGAPGADRSPAPKAGGSSPAAPRTGLVPARYLGTWSGSIDTSAGRSTRRLVIAQGEVGDTVLSLTADGPTDGGGTYHCVFKAPLQSAPTGKGPLRIGPSVVTAGEPAASCTPGAPTTVTVLSNGKLQRISADTGEKLTYTKGR